MSLQTGGQCTWPVFLPSFSTLTAADVTFTEASVSPTLLLGLITGAGSRLLRSPKPTIARFYLEVENKALHCAALAV